MLHESEPDNRKSIPKTLSKLVNKKQFDWKCLVGTTAVFTSLTATSLFLLGRTLSDVAEGPGLWTGNIHGVLNSQLLADPFTLVHFNHGIGLFLVLSAAGAGFLAATGLAAHPLGQNLPAEWGLQEPKTLGGNVLGCSPSERFSMWAPVGLFLSLEAAGWAWIGESVFLIAAGLLRKGAALWDWLPPAVSSRPLWPSRD